jgi:hypothetical protein
LIYPFKDSKKPEHHTIMSLSSTLSSLGTLNSFDSSPKRSDSQRMNSDYNKLLSRQYDLDRIRQRLLQFYNFTSRSTFTIDSSTDSSKYDFENSSLSEKSDGQGDWKSLESSHPLTFNRSSDPVPREQDSLRLDTSSKTEIPQAPNDMSIGQGDWENLESVHPLTFDRSPAPVPRQQDSLRLDSSSKTEIQCPKVLPISSSDEYSNVISPVQSKETAQIPSISVSRQYDLDLIRQRILGLYNFTSRSTYTIDSSTDSSDSSKQYDFEVIVDESSSLSDVSIGQGDWENLESVHPLTFDRSPAPVPRQQDSLRLDSSSKTEIQRPKVLPISSSSSDEYSNDISPVQSKETAQIISSRLKSKKMIQTPIIHMTSKETMNTTLVQDDSLSIFTPMTGCHSQYSRTASVIEKRNKKRQIEKYYEKKFSKFPGFVEVRSMAGP